jgi:hypothetical protein
MNTTNARKQYSEIRATILWEARSGYNNAKFDSDAYNLLTNKETPTPTDWINAAMKVRAPCGPCAGTGRFTTYVENGIPRGPGGSCFRCGGTGSQSFVDVKRNQCYDVNYRR